MGHYRRNVKIKKSGNNDLSDEYKEEAQDCEREFVFLLYIYLILSIPIFFYLQLSMLTEASIKWTEGNTDLIPSDCHPLVGY